MKHFMLCTIVCGIFLTSIMSQGFEYQCAWDPATSAGNGVSSGAGCFDVDEVMALCTPIYLRINVHYFVPDNCEGQIQQTGFQQAEVYAKTEKMIQLLNNEIKHNQPQRKIEHVDPPCLPFRFVLTGVYVHCESNAVAEFSTIELNQRYGVNQNGAINFYVAGFPQGATGVGYNYEKTGSASSFDPNIWWTLGNLYHELGHIFGLGHSFAQNDFCDDTAPLVFTWDKNCNGIIDVVPQNPKLTERGIMCWNVLKKGTKPGEPGYADENCNGVNDCEEVLPCVESPCCQEQNVDNNVMSYSAAKNAITKCQLKIMLNNINSLKCDVIEKIGGCPPTKAFISKRPMDVANENQCHECLDLSASWDETSYQLEIYELTPSGNQLVYHSGLKTEQAIKFCYKTNPSLPGSGALLKPNTQYRAILFTYNECSNSEMTYDFSTDLGNCGPLTFETLDVDPNPVNGNVVLHFNWSGPENSFSILARNVLTETDYPLSQSNLTTVGENSLNLSTEHLPPGTYIMMVQARDFYAIKNFIKL